MSKSFIIIGISDAEEVHLSEEVRGVISSHGIFSGGKRHRQLVQQYLPEDAVWIDITVPLQQVFDKYHIYHDTIVVFASGDPLFFGFANTVKRMIPDAEIQVYPTFHSLQLLAHRIVMPYHDMHHVSLTGRPWHAFDTALIQGYPIIGILTDGTHTPTTIAQRMIDYGYDNYLMTVGEHLGNEKLERIINGRPQEIAQQSFEKPNCVILQLDKKEKRIPPMGIPDADFELLDGREKMITKAPIRLLTLAALELRDKQSFWDIGFCTGSISIEAKRLFPHLYITAFEVREEGRQLMEVNSKRFGTPGIRSVISDFLADDLDTQLTEGEKCPSPDAIFIGGHGGHLKEIIEKAVDYLASGGVVVYNCVLPESTSDERIRRDSRKIFEETAQQLGMQLCPPQCVTINDYHPIQILKFRKP